MALPFTWNNILRHKKNNASLNISPYKNIIFKKSLYEKNPSWYYNFTIKLKL